MSEDLKTIKELADEFNVSKQAVRKRLTEEFRSILSSNSLVYLFFIASIASLSSVSSFFACSACYILSLSL